MSVMPYIAANGTTRFSRGARRRHRGGSDLERPRGLRDAGPGGRNRPGRWAVHAAADAALAEPELARIYESEGARPARGGGPDEFPAMLGAELARWREVAQAAGIRAE